MRKIASKKVIIAIAAAVVLLVAVTGGALADRIFGLKPLDFVFPRKEGFRVQQTILKEESVVVDVVKKVGPSVVTVSVQLPQRRVLQFSPFGGFSTSIQGGQPQDIGSGFILTADGLIATNKHVVSDTTATYRVVTSDGKTYDVKQISRDPANDIAILKIDTKGLKPVLLGDSASLEVGQFVIAIGTALGQFRNTVTTGVVSGLGRGIAAGDAFQGYVEQLDNVIQTDAAINPGNSGGPLLNSGGEVVGINVAVAQGAQNIGFAIPINVVKAAIDQFKATGKFPAKAFLGVEYQVIVKQTAILNNVPQGAYVVNIVSGSPADQAGLAVGDIIFKADGKEIGEDSGSLTKIIAAHQPQDKLTLEVWRNGETKTLQVTLSESNQ